MSNRFKKAVIDDVASRSIDEVLQASLLDLFEYAMKTSLSGILCLRHNMSPRSMYAKQEEAGGATNHPERVD